MQTKFVDGTDADGFTLSGDGRNSPFYVFDSEAQDWIAGPFKSVWVARLVCLITRLSGYSETRDGLIVCAVLAAMLVFTAFIWA